MSSENKVNKNGKKFKKFVLYGMGMLALILLIAHFIWMDAGSNEWKLVKDENGIKIWTIKTPGNKLLKTKANFQIQSTLGGIIKLIEDTTSWADLGMDKNKIVIMDTIHTPGYYSGYMGYKQEMPFPLKDREIITLMQRFQNPVTKTIEINVLAAPNKLPPSKDFVRIEHMHNSYTFTPVADGIVEIDFNNEFDLGGSIPYFIKNLGASSLLYTMMFDLKNKMSMDKYKNAKLDYIKEYDEN